MNKILSVIIPTYNMHDYLDRSLQSLILPGRKDLEVLVVNDGSKDDSLQIAQRYESKYPDIFRVIDKPNGNYGSCVNRGLKEATGKYVKVLDADDAYNTDTLKDVLKVMAEHDADAVITNWQKLFSDGSRKTISYLLPPRRLVDFSKVCFHLDMLKMWMHAIAYKRENLLKINYHQTEGVSYSDVEWVFLPLTTLKKIWYCPEVLYIYHLDRDGQTMSSGFFEKHFQDQIAVCKDMLLSYHAHKEALTPRQARILRLKLVYRTRYVHRFVILKTDGSLSGKLRELDDKLEEIDPDIYARLCGTPLSFPLVPYRIGRWLRHPHSPLLRLLIRFYRLTKRRH